MKEICKKYINKKELEDKIKNKKNIEKKEKEYDKDIKNYIRQIKELTKKLDQIYMDRLENLIDIKMYERIQKKVKEEIQQKKDQLKKEIQQIKRIKNNHIKEDNARIIEEYLSFNKPNGEMLSSLIDKIWIDEKKEINIIYKFNI